MSIATVQNKHRPARVLLVEDNPGDVILTRRAFREARIANELIVALTGEDALRMLRREDPHAALALPDLILLDLNLPYMNGGEVLQAVKTDHTLKHIPVIILSSSHADKDVIRSYEHHANGYVVKPGNLESFKDVVRKLEQFWFNLVVVPDNEDISNKTVMRLK